MENGESLYSAAYGLMEEKNYEQAVLLFERASKLMPESPEIWKGLGFVAFMSGNYELCAECNREVLRREPDELNALQGLGISLYELGRTGEGIRYMRRAAELTVYGDKDIVDVLDLWTENCPT